MLGHDIKEQNTNQTPTENLARDMTREFTEGTKGQCIYEDMFKLIK